MNANIQHSTSNIERPILNKARCSDSGNHSTNVESEAVITQSRSLERSVNHSANAESDSGNKAILTEFHQKNMRLALHEAERAAEAGEVPTGCVIVRSSGATPKIIARAHNQTEMLKDPTAHAEILAITQAAAALGDWRLTDTILYVTKEPCAMCAGAIVLARIPLVVWGLSDPKRGGHSVFSILNHEGLNHRPEIVAGVLETECREMFQAFFREKRGLKEELK